MSGIYVHIPFCKSRCSYCDFYSTVGSPHMERYVDAILSEARLRFGELAGSAVTTLYIGGGTPSQLPVALLAKLAARLRALADADCEFTVEVNPDDVSAPLIASLVDAEVNRISMGVQSFDDEQLRAVGRRHTARQAEDALATIRQAGIDNVSIDLIFGLPGQSLDSWRGSLQRALALRPDHLSAYGLSYEPGTPLWRQREQGLVREVDDETCVAMYAHLATAMRRAGYEHYEISNFALLGRRSRHNSAYWTGIPYLGLGAAAHSFDGSTRSHNPADIAAYLHAIEHGRVAAVAERLEPWQRYDERVMTSLRTCQGIDLAAIEAEFGTPTLRHLLRAAKPHLKAGRLRHTGSHIMLTEQGIMTSDAIISDLFAD